MAIGLERIHPQDDRLAGCGRSAAGRRRALRFRATGRSGSSLRRRLRARTGWRTARRRRSLRNVRRVSGHGLSAGERPARRVLRLSGSGYRQSRSRCAGSLFRMHPDAGARRACQPPNQWHGRVSGNRSHRHDAADHQMGHHGRSGRAHPLDDPPGGAAGADRQTRSGVCRASGRHRHGHASTFPRIAKPSATRARVRTPTICCAPPI